MASLLRQFSHAGGYTCNHLRCLTLEDVPGVRDTQCFGVFPHTKRTT
jgi:hypothetical protein